MYFPRYGQQLGQELMNHVSGLKTSVSILNNDAATTVPQILKFISNQQKQKLRGELAKLLQYNP